MGKGAIWIGMVFIVFGIWLGSKMLSSDESMWILIYPLFSIAIGIALIVFYKAEGTIEQRKDKQ